MKNSFNRFLRFNIILAFCLIAAGLLINQWSLGYLFRPVDGDIRLKSRILIWTFEIFCVAGGLFVYFKGYTRERIRRLTFSFIALTLIIIVIEVGLHIALRLSGANVRTNEMLSLSPYKDKEWAPEFWKYHGGAFNCVYEPFVGWARREYHSKYTNVDSRGVRKTWNPEYSHGTPATIYVFGGSTVWGTGVRDDYTIPSHLSKLLNNNGYDFIVYNYGDTGYTFTQEIIRLILLLREGYRPTYVIFYDGFNDVYGAYQSGTAGTTTNLSITREKLKKKSNRKLIWTGITGIFENDCMIYKAVKKMLAPFSQQQKFQEVASNYSEEEIKALSDGISEYYIKSMELLDHLSKAYGFEYICFWQPTIYVEKTLTSEEEKVDPRVDDKALGNAYRCTIASLAVKSPPRFFDISDALSERTKSCYIDFVHLSEEGNELVATKIFQTFKKEFLSGE